MASSLTRTAGRLRLMAISDVLSYLAIGVWLFVVSVGLLGRSIARTRYAQANQTLPTLRDRPGVTIIRPLAGLDWNLYENVERSFTQRYPNVEVILAVAREDDEAIPLARTLIERYPDIDARLIVGEENVGANPKVNNLARAYHEAKHDIVWIVDSNTLTSRDTLARSIAAFSDPRVGLVHHVPYVIYPGPSFVSRVEQAFLCTNHAKMYLAINRIAVESCILGKSMLFRRSQLDKATKAYPVTAQSPGKGLTPYGRFLGEDNMIGAALWHGLGLSHSMTADVAGNTIGTMSMRTYWERRTRWIRIRANMVTIVRTSAWQIDGQYVATLLEPFQECFLASTLLSLGVRYLFAIPFVVTWIAAVAIWHSIDVAVFNGLKQASPASSQRSLGNDTAPSLAFLAAWLMREALALPIWATAVFGGTTLGWRTSGQRYRLKRDGTVVLESCVLV